MNFKKIITSLFILFLYGCTASYFPPAATGGSKADAIISVTYGYPDGVNPDNWVEEWKGIDGSASERCKNWGYSAAVKFDRAEVWCVHWNGYGDCLYWKESLNYQCVD